MFAMRASTCTQRIYIYIQAEKISPMKGVRKHQSFLAKYDVLSTLIPKSNIAYEF